MVKLKPKGRKTEPWGNALTKINPEKTCRMFFQNVNGIREYGNDPKTHDGFKAMKKWKVGIIAISETKLNWRHPQVAHNTKRFIRKTVGPSSTTGSI